MASKSIKHLIAEVLVELGQTDDNMTPIIKSWMYDAQREIGSSKLNIKETDWLAIEDYAFDKPCGMIAPLRITISSNMRDCIVPHFRSDLAKCNCCENCHTACDIEIGENEDQFYLSSNAHHWRYAKIRYISVPVDDDGEPLIEEKVSRAVKQYVTMMFKKRMRMKEKDSVPMSEIDYENTQWIRLMTQAKGRQNMPNAIEMYGVGQAHLEAGISFSSFEARYGDYWGGYYGNGYFPVG